MVLATLLDPQYKDPVFTAEDTLNKAQQWIKEEQAIASESEQQQATTGDQGSDPKRIRVEEEDTSGLDGQMYANILGAQSHHGTHL